MGDRELTWAVKSIAELAKEAGQDDLVQMLQSLQEDTAALEAENDLLEGEVERLDDKLKNEGPGVELAQAVVTFAEWHWGGYRDARDRLTFETVSQSLWEDVSDRIRELTGDTPQGPCHRGEGHG